MNYIVQVNEVKGKESNIRAYANIVLDEVFKITNIAIIDATEPIHIIIATWITALTIRSPIFKSFLDTFPSLLIRTFSFQPCKLAELHYWIYVLYKHIYSTMKTFQFSNAYVILFFTSYFLILYHDLIFITTFLYCFVKLAYKNG